MEGGTVLGRYFFPSLFYCASSLEKEGHTLFVAKILLSKGWGSLFESESIIWGDRGGCEVQLVVFFLGGGRLITVSV